MSQRILYVEDNEDNIYMLQKRLQRKGYRVDVAMTGELGVEAAVTNPPDLILMDLSLPGIDGWEAIVQIRQHLGETLPIIALSTHAMETHIQQSLQAGANAFSSKPVDFPVLIQQIQAFLGGSE